MLENVIRRGVLHVGMTTIVPWATQDKSGELIGFEIDVARRLADDMDLRVKFLPTEYPSWFRHSLPATSIS